MEEPKDQRRPHLKKNPLKNKEVPKIINATNKKISRCEAQIANFEQNAQC